MVFNISLHCKRSTSTEIGQAQRMLWLFTYSQFDTLKAVDDQFIENLGMQNAVHLYIICSCYILSCMRLLHIVLRMLLYIVQLFKDLWILANSKSKPQNPEYLLQEKNQAHL